MISLSAWVGAARHVCAIVLSDRPVYRLFRVPLARTRCGKESAFEQTTLGAFHVSRMVALMLIIAVVLSGVHPDVWSPDRSSGRDSGASAPKRSAGLLWNAGHVASGYHDCADPPPITFGDYFENRAERKVA